jgi:hypothetical protein
VTARRRCGKCWRFLLFAHPVLVTVSSSGSSPFHSTRFPLPCTHRIPNTTAASSLNFGALLLAVGSPPQSTPHHYNPLGSFPSLTDAPKPLPVAGLPPELPRRRYRLADELLSPSNPSLHSFFVRFNSTNSFLSSCCSFWTGALPHFLTRTFSPTSASPPPPRPPWEPHLRPFPSPSQDLRRCALSS